MYYISAQCTNKCNQQEQDLGLNTASIFKLIDDIAGKAKKGTKVLQLRWVQRILVMVKYSHQFKDSPTFVSQNANHTVTNGQV